MHFASKNYTIAPTQRTTENAELVQRTVELEAPQQYQRQLQGADTWKMSDKTYRTCVPTPGSIKTGWCVLTRVQSNGHLKVVKYGFGISNAAQALIWHPELAHEHGQFE